VIEDIRRDRVQSRRRAATARLVGSAAPPATRLASDVA